MPNHEDGTRSRQMSQVRANMVAMAFGQSAGPPATARQLVELSGLLSEAGHTDFRDARGPMGFNQRQANGKFTRDEAETLIAKLQADADAQADSSDTTTARNPAPPIARPVQQRPSKPGIDLKRVSSEILAAELQVRGWIVVEP